MVGGGYSASRIKMKAGDTIVLTVGVVGAISSASINRSLENYDLLSVTSGTNGGNGTAKSSISNCIGGSAGQGGSASGGNYATHNGEAGIAGTTSSVSSSQIPTSGGAGGNAGYTGGNVGGTVGGGQSVSLMETVTVAGVAGKAGFIKIYRGNTNLDNNASELYTRLNYIESTGAQYIDTGVAPTTNMKLIINLTPISSSMSEHAIFGSTWAANGFFLMFYQNFYQ